MDYGHGMVSYLASSAKAIMAETWGAAADVPLKEEVQDDWVSVVVIWKYNN